MTWEWSSSRPAGPRLCCASTASGPGCPGRHGFPGDAGRAGQDAAPGAPRRHPRGSRQPGARPGAKPPRLSTDRPRGREPLSVPREPCDEGDVDLQTPRRADRHRRADAAARRGQELHLGAGGQRPARLPARCSRAGAEAGRAGDATRLAAKAFQHCALVRHRRWRSTCVRAPSASRTS